MIVDTTTSTETASANDSSVTSTYMECDSHNAHAVCAEVNTGNTITSVSLEEMIKYCDEMESISPDFTKIVFNSDNVLSPAEMAEFNTNLK
jgi:hypothetical protein